MIAPFGLKPTPAIHFGAGRITSLPRLLRPLGSRFLLLTGARWPQRWPGWSAMEQELSPNSGALFTERVEAEPTPQLIDAISARARSRRIDGVVAIGGGSVLDAGKAVAAMIPVSQGVAAYLEGVGDAPPPGVTLPFVAVPTTAGTGSEVTSNAVLAEFGATGYKRSLRHDRYVPAIALLDPELTLTCPARLTAACAMDAFTQLVEGYLSTEASPLTDAIALSGLSAVSRSLPAVVRDGHDLNARTDMAFASMCSGIVLANAGLGIVHGLAPVLGSRFSIPHGIVCGTLMAGANEVTLRRLRRETADQTHPALNKYRRLGSLFRGRRSGPGDDADAFIEALWRLTDTLELPRLGRYGVGVEDVDWIAAAATVKNNPAPLSQQEMAAIVRRRI